MKPFEPQLRTQQTLRFRLRANPTRTIKDGLHQRESQRKRRQPGELKSCRVPLIREEELFSWLLKKLDRAAVVEEVIIRDKSTLHFRKGDMVGKIETVTFDGVLTSQESEMLRKQLIEGIGPAKGFGCGLLSLARV